MFQNPVLKFLYSFFYTYGGYENILLTEEYQGCEIYIKINQPLVETDEFYSLNKTFIENSKLLLDKLHATTVIFSFLTVIGIIALAVLSKPKYVDEKVKLTFNQGMLFIIQLCIFAFFVFGCGYSLWCLLCSRFIWR